MKENLILGHSFPPPLKEIYNEELANQLAQTQGAIGSLRQTARLLQNPDLLMRPILAKEAESSSQLEGTQASIEDAYQIGLVEQSEEMRDEAQEIVNYEKAMYKGLSALEKHGLSEFVIREMHKTLLQGARGSKKLPGEFRKDEVWIGKDGTDKGKARYLPPDGVHVPALMEQLISFMQGSGKINPLIACGVIHHRFEAIHPFKDGNGRVGRLLITLYLVKEGLLTLPILYPSGYFEEHKPSYMKALSAVDQKEDWYTWLMFFLKGIERQAELSLKLVLDIDELYKSGKSVIEKEAASMKMITVLDFAFKQPYLTAPMVSRNTGVPVTTCKRYLNMLKSHNILSQGVTFKKQTVFINRKLINILKNI
jgi:Fic family protein